MTSSACTLCDGIGYVIWANSGRGGHCPETPPAGQGICIYSEESDKDMAVPFGQQQAMNMNATEACETGRTIRDIARPLV